jgi:hypothetical protein
LKNDEKEKPKRELSDKNQVGLSIKKYADRTQLGSIPKVRPYFNFGIGFPAVTT